MDHVTTHSLDAGRPPLNGSRRPTVDEPLPPDEIVKSAVRQFSAMSGRDVEAVIGWDRTDQGLHIEVEVVEVRQTPKVADIMATYEADVNERGRLCSYRRRRRYARTGRQRLANARRRKRHTPLRPTALRVRWAAAPWTRRRTGGCSRSVLAPIRSSAAS